MFYEVQNVLSFVIASVIVSAVWRGVVFFIMHVADVVGAEWCSKFVNARVWPLLKGVEWLLTTSCAVRPRLRLMCFSKLLRMRYDWVVSSSIRNLKIESDMRPTLLAWCMIRMRFVSKSVESEVVALCLEVCETGRFKVWREISGSACAWWWCNNVTYRTHEV